MFYNDKQILLQDRKIIKKIGRPYGFFGRTIEHGETPEQALKREMMEELTLDIDNFVLLKKIARPYADRAIEWYLYVAPMPDLSKIEVHERELFLTTLNEALQFDFSDIDKEMLLTVKTYLKA